MVREGGRQRNEVRCGGWKGGKEEQVIWSGSGQKKSGPTQGAKRGSPLAGGKKRQEGGEREERTPRSRLVGGEFSNIAKREGHGP